MNINLPIFSWMRGETAQQASDKASGAHTGVLEKVACGATVTTVERLKGQGGTT